MGNETSAVFSSKDMSIEGQAPRSARQRRYAPKCTKKRILSEQNRRTESLESDCGFNGNGGIGGPAAKAVSRKTSQQRQQNHQFNVDYYTPGISVSELPTRASTPNGFTSSSQHLLVPDFDSPLYYGTTSNNNNIRKGSCTDMVMSLEAPNSQSNRRRSRSLCSQQMKTDCQSVQSNQNGNNNNSGSGSRRSSNGTLPSLTRLRIQQCYKHAKPTIGHQILKRATTLRSEMKNFLAYLSEDRVEELAAELYNFISDCVLNIENADIITEISKMFGRLHVSLCNYGFRPEYFSIIADATIAECVKLDNGAHKRCETLLAWSQLMAFMFSGVRDGYYAEIRQQRRSSLPQHRMLLKQNSTNVSIDIDE
ncbi:hypothetical protein M3Y94_00373700 [Aphelenchoides besseyi]|nr:hypothetical protein M3Y94_00373700 [Aphelenchoides besseyi]KAI6235152.1 hypothetical protein M3Y95_00021000 [Aphelenchoides besseyi]